MGLNGNKELLTPAEGDFLRNVMPEDNRKLSQILVKPLVEYGYCV